MDGWWRYWRGRISPENCLDIVERAKQIPEKEATVGISKSVIDRKVRKSRLRWLQRFDPQFFATFGDMDVLFHDANKAAFGFNLAMFRDIQFTEYHSEDEGKYDWHIDTDWTNSNQYCRKLSMVIQLSDPADYEGGQLQLDVKACKEHPPRDVIQEQGTVIVFPSFLLHRVTPVTSGVRYSLVTWMEGPNFR